MLPQNKPDRIRILFDDHRLVANAGLILPATLALRLGLPQLLRKHLDLGGAPGRANTGDKMMTLVASALAGGDCIDDADVLRTGGTACTLGGTVKAPSTLGTSLGAPSHDEPSGITLRGPQASDRRRQTLQEGRSGDSGDLEDADGRRRTLQASEGP